MAIVKYHCAKGRLIGEDTNGIRTDYMTDALGSVTGTVNSSQAVVNTYRYKPFGELLAKTGTGADPKFMWNGGTQSRRTSLGFSDQYNRGRHYGTRQGQWTTVDPLWPEEPEFVYAGVTPVSQIDPSGRKPISTVCPPPPRPTGPVSCSKDWNQYIYAFCNCFRYSYHHKRECNLLAMTYYTRCGKPKPRGDYVEFSPPPGGVGEVTPRPVPSPFPGPPVITKPPDPTICPAPIREHDISPLGQGFANDCVSKARDSTPGEGTAGYLMTLIHICHRCCKSVHPLYAGECHDACRILGLGIMDHVSAVFGDAVVSPPSPGAGYGATSVGRTVPPVFIR